MVDATQRGTTGSPAPKGSLWSNLLGGTRRVFVTLGKAISSHKKTFILGAVIIIAVAAAMTWWLMSRSGETEQKAAGPVVAEYQKRLPELEKGVKDAPNDPTAHKNYAVALYATGDYKGARDQYEAAVKLNDKDATAYNNLGNAYRDLGNTSKAIESYQKSIERNKTSINTYVNLANIQLYTQKDSDAAIATYKNGLKNLPDNEQLQLLLGIAYEQADQIDNAKQTYEAILAKHEDNAAAKANLDRLNE